MLTYSLVYQSWVGNWGRGLQFPFALLAPVTEGRAGGTGFWQRLVHSRELPGEGSASCGVGTNPSRTNHR